MSGSFKDHFSGHAGDYAVFRPEYPAELFDWLASRAPGRHLAWDVATGNGQAARVLARYFERVVASDASAEQIAQATGPAHVDFRVEPAEGSSLADGSVDLVTVAQACHWFDHAAFVDEVGRVSASGGVAAIWTYELARVNPVFDGQIDTFYRETIGPWWPPERCIVERGYRDLDFPWPELDSPRFVMRHDWTLDRFEGYLRTWSAVRRCQAVTGKDPVAGIHERLLDAWGVESGRSRTVEWPLAVRAFRLG
ncbi:class I SAM-dependent methyltransferase [Elongatibacter sediminis]|uniref:Class I SAM-dependent methyltransferase n=1 Tax=Elongatibacter sediminis TaxID=3119006 RepID=A0AAW9R6V9_9GAMM